MNNTVNEMNEKEISLSKLLQVLRKNLVIILIVSILLATAAGLYSFLFQETKYTAKAEFQVKNMVGTSGYISDTMLAAGSRIANACVEAAEKDLLAKKVVREHELDKHFGMPESDTIKYVKKIISAEKPSANSQAFSITVTSTDPEHSYKVILAIQDVMPDVVKEITTVSDENGDLGASELAFYEWVETPEDVVAEPSAIPKLAILGALAGFVLCYAVCFIIDINDTKVYDEDSIKANFTQPIIGTIPQWIVESDSEVAKLSRKKILARDLSKTTREYTGKLINKDTPFAITESFKQLRTNLCYSIAATEKCPVFAITSDFSASGKSLISANLAITFSQLGKKTLLVECDLRCPEFRHIFKSENTVGLSDLISGNVENESDVFADIGYENINVIFSGRIPPNPSELLGSNKMKELVDAWASEYDVVLLDLPPVFEVADACVISTLVSGYILVARSEHSDVTTLGGVVDSIRRVNGNISGFVLNDVNMKVGANGYYSKGKYGKYAKYRQYSQSNNK